MKRLLVLLLLAANAAFGATLNPIQLLNPAGSTSGQAIVSTGPSTAPAWAGINAVTLNGATFASPGLIGSVTPNAAAFTTVTGTGITGTSFAGPGTGYSITTSTGLSSGGGIQIFDGTHGSNVGITNNGTTVASFTSAGIVPVSTIGIKGTTTNDSPAAGSVGEVITNSTSGTALSSGVSNNCTSASLTAGQWSVSGVVEFVAAAGTTYASIAAGVSTTSVTFGSIGTFQQLLNTFTAGTNQYLAAPATTVKLASTSTIFLVGNSGFGTSTMTCSGFISAVRIR